MDKYKRPYQYEEKRCEKLRVFTYLGGLLRHEREVHGEHISLKQSLICPYDIGKHSSEHVFTRQENLNEHLRCVHHIALPASASADGGYLTGVGNASTAVTNDAVAGLLADSGRGAGASAALGAGASKKRKALPIEAEAFSVASLPESRFEHADGDNGFGSIDRSGGHRELRRELMCLQQRLEVCGKEKNGGIQNTEVLR
jgi:hypothetical protein